MRFGVVDFTFSSSYTTGGEALALGSTPLSGRTIVGVFPESKAGYIFDYDYTNKKLRAWQANYPAASAGALTEVPNATNLAAVTVRCLVVTL